MELLDPPIWRFLGKEGSIEQTIPFGSSVEGPSSSP